MRQTELLVDDVSVLLVWALVVVLFVVLVQEEDLVFLHVKGEIKALFRRLSVPLELSDL